MKRQLFFPIICFLVFSGCGPSLNCDSVGTVAEEGAKYLCSVLSKSSPSSLSALSLKEKAAALDNFLSVNQSIIASSDLATKSAMIAAENGEYQRSNKILLAVSEVGAYQDSLRECIKILQGVK